MSKFSRTANAVFILAFTLAGAAPVTQTGVDGPVKPEDLPARVADEARRRDEDVNLLTEVRLVIQSAVGPSTDPNLVARLVHADSLITFRRRDHAQAEARLFSEAASAAARIAEFWEAKAANPNPSIPGPDEEAFAVRLKDLDDRAALLAGKQPLSPEDKAELASLDARRRGLRDSIALFKRIKEEANNPAKFAAAAEQMRAQERFLRLNSQDAQSRVSEYDIACLSAKLTLQILAERQSIQRELARFSAKPALPISAQAHSTQGPAVFTPTRGLN